MHSSTRIPLARTVGRSMPGWALGALLAAAAVPGLAADTATADAMPGEAQSSKPLPVKLVGALNALSGGPHEGYRANHAKGVLATGTFTPTKEAASISKAPHFAQSVPVLVRFSNTTGVPDVLDADPNAGPYGIAIRFQLPGGGSTDIVSISADSFPVATPEEFLAMLQAVKASGPDAAKPTPIEQFFASHPAAAKWVTTSRPAPQSFATIAFYGINAFKFTNAKGESKYTRYQIIPVAGEHPLENEKIAKADPQYLMDGLPKRIAEVPVSFKLLVKVANESDPITDATKKWPDDRPIVELSTIRLDSTPADQVAKQRELLFNPVSLPEGIDPSQDPILLARFPSYAVSFQQRAK